jgi:hypothetical protein
LNPRVLAGFTGSMPMAVPLETPVANVSGPHLVWDHVLPFMLLGDPNWPQAPNILLEKPFLFGKGGHASTSVMCVLYCFPEGKGNVGEASANRSCGSLLHRIYYVSGKDHHFFSETPRQQ